MTQLLRVHRPPSDISSELPLHVIPADEGSYYSTSNKNVPEIVSRTSHPAPPDVLAFIVSIERRDPNTFMLVKVPLDRNQRLGYFKLFLKTKIV